MKCFFDSCSHAVEYATDTRSFGMYYSEMQEPNSEIHIHECCELLLCLKGGKSFLIDNNMYEAEKDRKSVV